MTDHNDTVEFHGSSGPPPGTAAEPSLAERARTLMLMGGHSSLATMSRKHAGYPFASVMPYGLDEHGGPIFLISQMAMHTKNIAQNPRATLLVSDSSPQSTPLGAARISVMGDVVLVDEVEKAAVASSYLARHPDARQWAAFGDFAYYRMQVVDVYFIGGFGVMGWISAGDYAQAAPDPLFPVAAEIMSHMNQDHTEALVLLSNQHLGVTAKDAHITAVDRYGFNVMYKSSQGVRGGRIEFPQQVSTAEETRSVFVEMVRSARAKGQ